MQRPLNADADVSHRDDEIFVWSVPPVSLRRDVAAVWGLRMLDDVVAQLSRRFVQLVEQPAVRMTIQTRPQELREVFAPADISELLQLDQAVLLVTSTDLRQRPRRLDGKFTEQLPETHPSKVICDARIQRSGELDRSVLTDGLENLTGDADQSVSIDKRRLRQINGDYITIVRDYGMAEVSEIERTAALNRHGRQYGASRSARATDFFALGARWSASVDPGSKGAVG